MAVEMEVLAVTVLAIVKLATMVVIELLATMAMLATMAVFVVLAMRLSLIEHQRGACWCN